MNVATPLSGTTQECLVYGNIEYVSGNSVFGWAFNKDTPQYAVNVGVRVGQTLIGSGTAGLVIPKLQRAGLGADGHGFCIPLDMPFRSGQRLELELVDMKSGQPIAANPFTLYCRDPQAVATGELDSRGVHGLPSRRRSRRRRQFDAVTSPIMKPLSRILKHYQSRTDPCLPAGSQAKLARIEHMSVASLDSVESWPLLTLPERFGRPSVSIIIPVHNQFHLTYQCLASLVLSDDRAECEVIVVDDASTDATRKIESRVENLSVLRNATNLGFLHSCNKAASEASGDFIVFLNNDTEVGPGWIDSMLDVFASFSDVGAVGAKLIYPDGSLQDAGGIVWDSGMPWNVGHGKDSDDPEYNYVREADYLTGAALMVSRKAWDAVDGFSEQYAPAYYEDTDLAFKLRAAGFRTFYCPQAVVVHYEGRSHGTDTSSGVKLHQLVNAEHFKATWKQQFGGHGVEGVDLRRQKDRNRGLRVLMVDNSFPRLGQDAGSYAAVQEIKLLLALGCKVTFLPHNLLHLGVHVDFLQKLGVECVHAPFHRSVSRFLEKRAAEFDVVYITRYVVAEKITSLVRQYSSARIIFNNADLHFLRELRSAWVEGEVDMSSANETRRRELNVMREADVVLSYSDVELEIIASHLLVREKLFQCPWVLTPKGSSKSFEQRENLAFLGGFAHPPNSDAVEWFLSHVMPLLRKSRPSLELHIWGSHIPENIGWGRQEGVILKGYAANLDDVFDSALAFVAPLQAGAGIKGKVLDSLAYGVPTILSPVAAEATGLIDGSSTLIAYSPEQWVEHIESLLDDSVLWERIRSNSTKLRDQRYSFEAGIVAMQKVFDYLELDTNVVQQQVAGQ